MTDTIRHVSTLCEGRSSEMEELSAQEKMSVQEQLLDHASRLKILENNYSNIVGEISSVKSEVTSVKNGQLQLENTVLKTSQDQNGLLNTLITNTFDLKKTKAISRKEIIIAGISSGGILGVVVGAILKFV